MLSQFTRQKQAYRSLYLAAGDGRAAVVVGQLGGFVGDPLKDVIGEGVHDAHGLARDASVWVNLLQDLS